MKKVILIFIIAVGISLDILTNQQPAHQSVSPQLNSSKQIPPSIPDNYPVHATNPLIQPSPPVTTNQSSQEDSVENTTPAAIVVSDSKQTSGVITNDGVQQYYKLWCHLTYSDGSTYDISYSGVVANGGIVPDDCFQFIGQAK